METFKNIISELGNNKGKRALLSLLLWFIFIFVITRMIGKPPADYYSRSSNVQSNTITKNGKENLNQAKNFEFEYKVDVVLNKNNYNYVINGTFFDDKNFFEMNGVSYYNQKNKIYLVDDTRKILKLISNGYKKDAFGLIDISLLLKNSLYTFLDSSVEESKTTYKDGSVVINYSYVTSDNKKISINTTEDNGIINTIVLDFKNYYVEKKYESFIVTCNLKNINNIAEYKKNYDDYVVEGE